MSAHEAFSAGLVKGVKGLSVTAPHARRENQETLHNPSPDLLADAFRQALAARVEAVVQRREQRRQLRTWLAERRTAGKARYHAKRLGEQT